MTYILFREEVSTYKTQSLGAIKIATPISRVGLSIFFFTLAFGLSCFFCFGHYTRRARVHENLVPSAGILQIRAREIGIVRHLLVHENQFVKKNQAIAQIANTQRVISKILRKESQSLNSDLLTLKQSSSAQKIKFLN